MITQRAVLFGFVGFCFYLIAIVNALPPFYYALTWLTAGVLVSCLGLALLSLFGLKCSWSLSGSVVAEAPERSRRRLISFFSDEDEWDEPEESVEVESAGNAGLNLRIANGGTFNKTDITIEVRLRELRTGTLLQRRFLIEALPAGTQLDTTLPLHDLTRGRYEMLGVRLSGSDVLGLFRFRKTIAAQTDDSASATEAAPAEEAATSSPNSSETQNANAASNDADASFSTQIVVGPAMLGLAQVQSGNHGGGGTGGGRATRVLGRSEDLSGTRPYVAGDDLRFVHWKSTARRGELVVREWERTASHQALVIWDGAAIQSAARARRRLSPLTRENAADASTEETASNSSDSKTAAQNGTRKAMSRRSGEGETRAVDEWSLRLAASLCRALNESGQPCGLLRLDANPQWVAPAGRGGGASVMLSRVLESLADAMPSRRSPLSAAVTSSLRHIRGGSIFLVTSSLDADVSEAIRVLRHVRGRVVVCLVDASRWEEARSTVSPRRGAKKSPIEEQEQRLREAGATVLRAPLHGDETFAVSNEGADASSGVMVPNAATQRARQAFSALQARRGEISSAEESQWLRSALRTILHPERSSSAGSSMTPPNQTSVVGADDFSTPALR